MNAYDQSRLLANDLSRRFNRLIMPDEANILRRAEMTLHRWHEEECNGAIQRPFGDGGDSRPYRPTYQPGVMSVIPDREAGAIRRVKEVCGRLGLYFYVQTDPRGAALYVSDEPIDDRNYTDGVCCAIR